MPYYENNGYKLYYAIAGEGQPIIFIHGYLGDSNSHWKHQLSDPNLMKSFMLIAPDLRGFGKSLKNKKGERHRTTEFIEDLHYLINNHLHLKQRPIIVGYSVGAAFSLVYALTYPDDVSALVLLSPRPFMGKTARSYPFLSKDKRSTQKKTNLIWSIVKRIQKVISYLRIRKHLITSRDYLRSISELTIPIAIIYGTKDTVTPKISYRTLIKYLPKAEVIKVEADHGISHEAYEKFNAILYDFCNKVKNDNKQD